MRNDVKLDGWRISAESGGMADAFAESIFFTGNGRMGVRGYSAFRPQPRPVETGLFVAGVFDEIKPGAGITDFVNLPTPVYHTIKLNGQAAMLSSGISRILDMRTGTLTLQYQVSAPGATLTATEERFFPPDRPDLMVRRLALYAEAEVEVSIFSGVENDCCNCPVPDDQVKQNNEVVQLTRHLGSAFEGTRLTTRYTTHQTNIELVQTVSFCTRGLTIDGSEDDSASGLQFCGHVGVQSPATLEKLVHIATSRDVDPRIGTAPANWSYEALREENRLAWEAKWDDCGILLEGDDDAQTALRYTVYQLVVNCSARDGTVNIGARGLTHTRYKGCYFWDTDLFMVPFYLLTDPEAARNLMRYRVNTLPQAKEHAGKMGGAGARYPWMVSYDGTEQCESWDIGCSEVHVTADVAYAAGQYMAWAGDKEFFRQGGAELLFETARYWISRYSPEPGTDRVNLLFCKGPDEYCGITNNNLFTNMMVQHNLDMAMEAAELLRRESSADYCVLIPDESEVAAWRQLRQAIKLPKDPDTGHWRTDDTFHLLEDVDLKTLKADDEASYHNVCFDRLQRYKVVKQADVLLLMTRLAERFTAQEKADAWADFEPLCLHDSTLSFASHALFAAQNGLTDAAKAYFDKAVYLDLKEVMGNTGKEGLHLACLGESWQAVVFGFAGLHIKEGLPQIKPQLPASWRSLQFKFAHMGKRYRVSISSNSSSIEQISCD